MCSYQEYTAKETTMSRVSIQHDPAVKHFKRELPVEFTSRLAVPEDVPALTVLMDRAIAELQRAFLDDAQIASSRAIMGIDTQLIDDGTYFVVESGADIAGCGGWSRRATLYGGNHTPGRDSNLLLPSVDPARVRAMYTNPDYARRGVGRLVLSLCEAAAAAEGFSRLELMSTLSGEPLYTAYGFRPLERVEDSTGGAPVPLVRMEKPVDPRLLH
jgi:GNAT superfamily N-acetyltransferase